MSCLSATKAAALAHVLGVIVGRERGANAGHFGFDLHS